MPLYEFMCESCDGVFEALRPIREAGEPAPCPVCNRDGKRMMPSSFSAFTFRDGYPRRIPDKGTYWHLGKEVKNLVTGGVQPNEHPEINKPIPRPAPARGDIADATEAMRLKALADSEAARERKAAIEVYDKEQAKKAKTADAH